jgi:hypothetical protein
MLVFDHQDPPEGGNPPRLRWFTLPAHRICGCPGTITEEVRPRLASIFPMHQQSE